MVTSFAMTPTEESVASVKFGEDGRLVYYCNMRSSKSRLRHDHGQFFLVKARNCVMTFAQPSSRKNSR